MAGIDRDFQGEAWPGENITVGYLPQEPQLDSSKSVLENVKDGARDVADMVDAGTKRLLVRFLHRQQGAS